MTAHAADLKLLLSAGLHGNYYIARQQRHALSGACCNAALSLVDSLYGCLLPANNVYVPVSAFSSVACLHTWRWHTVVSCQQSYSAQPISAQPVFELRQTLARKFETIFVICWNVVHVQNIQRISATTHQTCCEAIDSNTTFMLCHLHNYMLAAEAK